MVAVLSSVMDIKTLFAAHGVVKLHLAKALGITHGAVNQWRRVPAERVIDVERATGIPREKLRPDLYPSERAA
jgi:DNA-binding transcriptional regulator YdaS (Cro superfamily)